MESSHLNFSSLVFNIETLQQLIIYVQNFTTNEENNISAELQRIHIRYT